MRKRHVVVLSEEERARLHTMIGRGVAPASALTHAAIAVAVEVNPATVARVRMRYAAAGLDAAVYRKPPAPVPPSARRGAGGPPGRAGVQRATGGPQALDAAAAGRADGGACGGGDGLARDGAAGLEANRLKPWLTQRWCIPPAQDAEFCWRMEDVLAVYTRAYDPRRPQVCLDETSRQLLAEVTPPRPVAPGRPAREDYEYERRGVCNLFLVCEPLRGWRQVMVSARRTRIDWAHSRQGPGRRLLPRRRADRAGARQPGTPTRPRRCTRRSRPRRPSAWPTGWSCPTRPSTAAG